MFGVKGVPWTDEERQQLRRLHDNGMSQSQIAQAMGRSKNSIHRQLANIGLIRSDRNSVVAERAEPGRPTLRAPRTTLPPLPSLSIGPDGECKPEPWDGKGWPPPDEFFP
jgi:Helix-turn-helix domain